MTQVNANDIFPGLEPVRQDRVRVFDYFETADMRGPFDEWTGDRDSLVELFLDDDLPEDAHEHAAHDGGLYWHDHSSGPFPHRH